MQLSATTAIAAKAVRNTAALNAFLLAGLLALMIFILLLI
jgi:hypothetical protein